MKYNFNFEFSPNLIILLGEQLIHDKKIAISELVKNSYDADASKVTVNVNNAQIVITDDGFGMDLNIIKNIWLKPGVSSKNINELTPKYKRIPIGEKGVGRLGCHKLGHIIEVWTKSESNNEIYLKIDWRKLVEVKSLQDLPAIEVIENNNNKVFNNGTGTKILITNLKDEWLDSDFEKLSTDLLNLIAPFSSNDNFNIIFKKNNELIINDLKEEANFIKKNALFSFDVTIKNGLVSKFDYKFKPWQGLEKVDSRNINIKNNIDFLQKQIGNNKTLSFDKESSFYEKSQIGEVNFYGFIYDFDNILWNIQRQLLKIERRKIIKYMRANGGVRVYRDNFRVFNYGEVGNDILELDLKRVNRPAGKISSNQILAAIKLSRQHSTGLIEKTNREGFINNQSFYNLQKMLDEVLDIISNFRQDDKAKIIRVYLKGASDRASIESKINDIKNTINNSDLNTKDKDKINKNLDVFAKDFVQIKDIFMNAANTGLSLTIVIHELDKVVINLISRIKQEDWVAVVEVSKILQIVVNNYKDIIRLDKKSKPISVTDIIEKAIFNCNARFDFHTIEIIQDLEGDLHITVKRNLIIGTFNNLFDNAIYWLKYQQIEHKKILIKTYKKDKQIHLVIADNGKGFTISFESAIMPFITGRKDESSMGIGLHLADKIMEAHQGFLVEGNFAEEGLPLEFKDGAIVKLIFKE